VGKAKRAAAAMASAYVRIKNPPMSIAEQLRTELNGSGRRCLPQV
jgi:hypothetical protein